MSSLESPSFARAAAIEVPYEEGTYWRKGTKHGPRAIRQLLADMRPNSLRSGRRLQHPIDDYFVDSPELTPYDKDECLRRIEQSIDKILQSGRAPVVVGGDHSISLPTVRALARHHGARSFSIIHFDAHSDTFPSVGGYDYHHGAIFRKMVEEGLVDGPQIYQLGVRGFVRDNGMDFASSNGIQVFSVEDCRRAACDLEALGIDLSLPCYVSFDVDAVDPAFAPGTGTPVPGGLTSSEALSMLSQAATAPLVGFDVVEIAPVYDSSEITVLLGAHMVMELLVAGRFVASIDEVNA